MKLFDYQLDAIKRMKNGCILCGSVGTGKSLTSLAYYASLNGGDPNDLTKHMKEKPMDLYIITTAMKRDKGEWEYELNNFNLSSKDLPTNIYKHKCVIDSWNNIKKYVGIENAFFIFDEQRVVGKGTWVNSFLKIAKVNQWILLSATPGDTWSDYIPVFIANGFYRNRTEFSEAHEVKVNCGTFWKVDRYIGTGRLIRLRNNILVTMDVDKHAQRHQYIVDCEFDRMTYKRMMHDRWDIWKDEPMENAGELCYGLRRIVNSDPSRVEAAIDIFDRSDLHRVIIFYNFDYELDILKGIDWGFGVAVAEWNGHKHQQIPDTDNWVYLVQYTAGCEGWNCIKTNTIIFFSQNYSYKVMVQASGRIDRLNTPFTDLYYYFLKSNAPIDHAIGQALAAKKKFNEGSFINW